MGSFGADLCFFEYNLFRGVEMTRNGNDDNVNVCALMSQVGFLDVAELLAFVQISMPV